MAASQYPPDGVRLKLARAQQHLDELRTEIDAFFEDPPFRYVLHADEAGLNFALVGYLTHGLPEMLPLIIGDSLQNMRVALDHLAWALAESTGEEPPHHTSFPIYLNPDAFHERSKAGKATSRSGLRRIEALPEEAQPIIETLQPYHSEDPELDPLWILNEYSRIDRHRKLSVMYSLSDYEECDIGTLDNSGNFVPIPDENIAHFNLASGAFYHGMQLARFTLKEPVPNLHVRYESPQYIAFGQPYISIGNPLEVLSDIHRHILQTVLPPFARFF